MMRFLLDELFPDTTGSRSAVTGGAPHEKADFNETMKTVAASRATKGVVIVLSDFLIEEGYEVGLRALSAASRNFDCYMVQVLAREELEPNRLTGSDASGKGGASFGGDLRLTDVESAAHTEITLSTDLIQAYKKRLDDYLARISTLCHARQMQHVLLANDTKLEDALLNTLRRAGAIG